MAESNSQKAVRLAQVYFRNENPLPYQVETNGANVYTRWSTNETDPIFILRTNTVTVGPVTTVTNAYTIARWADRATAAYEYEDGE